jgi:Na+/proline symporter
VIWVGSAALSAAGGFTSANQAVAALDPTLLSVWGRGMAYEGQWGIAIGAVMVFSIGVLGWPHLVTRHMAMARPATARRAGGYAILFNLLFVPTPYLVGIIAIVLLPHLDDPEMAIFSVAEQLLPSAVTGLVMAAIMAAIMSTADSLLLQTGSVASRDLFQRFVRPGATEHQMVWVSRALILTIGVIGFVVALSEPPTVFRIVVFSTSVLGSAFLPAFVCAVWWRKANTPGAISSMVAGACIAFSWEAVGPATVHPMLAGMVSSSVTMLLVSLLTQKSAPVGEGILRAIDQASA